VRRTLGVAATVGVLAVLMAAVLTACGSEDGDSNGVASLTDTTSTTEGGDSGDSGSAEKDKDPKQAAIDYAKCMREHGVEMPDPSSNGELRLRVRPGNEQKVEAAQKACQHIIENAGPRLTEEQQSVMKEALLAFAKCMREHGIDMPDPQFGEGGLVTQKGMRGSEVDPDDPKFREAQKACEPIMKEAQEKAGLPKSSPSFGRSGGS
jgi:hypothetical protein